MQLTDALADSSLMLQNSGANIVPVISSGLRFFHLFGGDLRSSLRNLADPTTPAAVIIIPTIGSNSVTVGAGATGNIQLAFGPEAGSETIFMIASSTISSADGNMRSNPMTSQQSGTGFGFSEYGVQGNAYFTNGSNTNGYGPSIWNNRSQFPDPSSWPILSVPQVYCLEIDTVAATISLSNLSQSSGWSETNSIPSGYTRVVDANHYQLAGTFQSQQDTVLSLYAAAGFSRAITSAERASVYAQLQTIMAARGVTV